MSMEEGGSMREREGERMRTACAEDGKAQSVSVWNALDQKWFQMLDSDWASPERERESKPKKIVSRERFCSQAVREGNGDCEWSIRQVDWEVHAENTEIKEKAFTASLCLLSICQIEAGFSPCAYLVPFCYFTFSFAINRCKCGWDVRDYTVIALHTWIIDDASRISNWNTVRGMGRQYWKNGWL